MTPTTRLALLAGASALLAVALTLRHQPSRQMRQRRERTRPSSTGGKRGGFRDRPRDWDIVDERADESFPASDPPGGY